MVGEEITGGILYVRIHPDVVDSVYRYSELIMATTQDVVIAVIVAAQIDGSLYALCVQSRFVHGMNRNGSGALGLVPRLAAGVSVVLTRPPRRFSSR